MNLISFDGVIRTAAGNASNLSLKLDTSVLEDDIASAFWELCEGSAEEEGEDFIKANNVFYFFTDSVATIFFISAIVHSS